MTIRLYTELAAHFADMAEVVHIFYPEADVVPAEPGAVDMRHAHWEADGWIYDAFTFSGEMFRWTTRAEGDALERKRRRKRAIKQCCYYLLKTVTGISPPWGSLTGIRPTRLFYERLARGDKPAEAREALMRLYDLQEDRAQLLSDTADAQRGLIEAPENAVDIYVGIPFCASRCAYCSFFSEAIGKGRKVGPYLGALYLEIDACAAIVREAGLSLRALYVGGGTPTSLPADSLSALLARLRERFPGVREWTVEAGRPDTIDGDKLAAMRAAGVTRISVNPQTMRDETLRTIGRAHTAGETRRAFKLAREAGFANINMDVIAALPDESVDDFRKTLGDIAGLGPDSLTVHTLARKHGSSYNEFGFDPVPGDVAAAMVELGASAANAMGMRPYYLYRQKYVAGNLENVAYALPGKECLYNIDIMEETTSVLAAGAGAISKRVSRREARIERAPNAGDIGHYMARIDALIGRKRKLWGLSE